MSEITKEELAPEEQSVKERAKTVSDEKFERRVVAFTVGAVVLLAILIVLMCYQLIKIGVQHNRVNTLKADIAALEQQYEKGEDTLEIRRKAAYIEMRARELGYRYADDK